MPKLVGITVLHGGMELIPGLLIQLLLSILNSSTICCTYPETLHIIEIVSTVSVLQLSRFLESRNGMYTETKMMLLLVVVNSIATTRL